jgi:hypothetical protein
MSALDTVSGPLRVANTTKNKFFTKEYNASNPDALSLGDGDWGKGENNGSIGGKEDIARRVFLLARGTGVYANGTEYNSSNF